MTVADPVITDLPAIDASAPTVVLRDAADGPVSEVAERFLRAVLADVPLESIEELHLFSPLRQGAIETGIAVLAARRDTPPADADVTSDEAAVEASDDAAVDATLDVVPEVPEVPVVRHTVYTARYRLVIKGPERGKWETSIKAEADAPLVTVETVVRGVQRRAGEDSEIVRFSGGQIARALRLPAA